jgi:hypothetical protein
MSTYFFQSANTTNLTQLSAEPTFLYSLILYAPSTQNIAPNPPNLLQLGFFALFDLLAQPVLGTDDPFMTFQFTLEDTNIVRLISNVGVKCLNGLWFSCTYTDTSFPPPVPVTHYNPLVGGNVKAIISYR